jgi:hypothetical protein
MLLHIEPRLFAPFRNVAIVDLAIKALGLRLAGGADLSTGRPYPNKRYAVAHRKNRTRKAFNGILIETSTPLDDFEIVTRWAVNAERVVTHHVRYRLLDHDFDAASEDTMFWRACCAELGGWSNRWPSPAPVQSRPMMEVLPREYDEREKPVTYQDTLDAESGWIIKRRQSYAMPTVESERILYTKLQERIPPLVAAFLPGGGQV